MTVVLNHEQLLRVRNALDEALSLASDQRLAFIRDASDGDALIQSELLSLVEAHDASEGFFERLSEDLIFPVILGTEDNAGDDALLSNLKLPRYQVLERIGGGGMGLVYKGLDTQLGRTVALKFLPRRHASNPGARAQLIAEARAASRLDHPNIGVIYEIGEAGDGRQFIAMAWYDGETLRDRIRHGPVSETEAVAIALKLGDALAEAHQDGIVHRDVKPANVMITRSGGVKLVDFGIAKLMSEDDGARPGVAGTLAYMSPEQTENLPLDARTDIWSLGVLLYETLTGRRPFRGDSDEQLIAAIRNEAHQPLASLRPDIDVKLANVIERCLQKDRNVRLQTVVAFCEALRSSQPVARPSRKYWKAMAVAAAVTLAIAAIMTWRYGRTAYINRVAMQASGRSIAVLPFSSESTSDSSAYAVDALAEDLRTDLGRLRPLTVPGYLSSISYAESAKPDSQIARELGANYLIHGVVQQSDDGAALDLLLIDARTGAEKFSKHYVANPGRVDIIREATRDVAAALSVPLTQEQQDKLGHDRTTNAAAYDLYLRGLHAELSGMPRAVFGVTSPETIRSAQGFYAQARTLDAGFGAVRARLAGSHVSSGMVYDTTTARLDQARLEAEASLRIDPQLSRAHEALSGYWKRVGDTNKSIDELKRGLAAAPNDVALHVALGVRYLELGRREEAVAEFEEAIRLDPRNPVASARVATTYGRLDRRVEGLRAFNHFIEISPNDYEVRLIKGQFYMKWKGTPDTLLAELRNIPADWDDRGMATFSWYTALRVQRRYREGLEILSRSKSRVSRDGIVWYPTSLMQGDMYDGLGDTRKARTFYQRARSEAAESAIADPGNAGIHAALALADAGLGRRSDAIAEAQRAVDLARTARDGNSSMARMGTAVEVYARVGDLDRAFETMELLFAMPAGRDASSNYVRIWPGFDPLRKDPRFDELLKRFAVK